MVTSFRIVLNYKPQRRAYARLCDIPKDAPIYTQPRNCMAFTTRSMATM